MEVVQEIIRALFQAILGSPEAVAVIVAFVLTLVPGPFKGFVNSLINWILERWRNSLEVKKEASADKVATIAVLHAEDVKNNLVSDGMPKQQAGTLALDEALKTARAYGLFENDPQAEARVRAKYQELKLVGNLPIVEVTDPNVN